MDRLLDVAADLLLGAKCPACMLPGWSLCMGCREALGMQVPRLVIRDGPTLPIAKIIAVQVIAAVLTG